jgi:hypothetical protein
MFRDWRLSQVRKSRKAEPKMLWGAGTKVNAKGLQGIRFDCTGSMKAQTIRHSSLGGAYTSLLLFFRKSV